MTAEGASRTASSASFSRPLFSSVSEVPKSSSKNSSPKGSRLSALTPFRIIISRKAIFFAGYPSGLMQGITSSSPTSIARSKAPRFMVPAIQVVPTPMDSANRTTCSKEYPKASSAWGTRPSFPAMKVSVPTTTGLESPSFFPSRIFQEIGMSKGFPASPAASIILRTSSSFSAFPSKVRTLRLLRIRSIILISILLYHSFIEIGTSIKFNRSNRLRTI